MKVIVFDFGGVVINIDFTLAHKAFRKMGIENLDQLFSQNTQSGFFDDFEKGFVSEDEFRNHFLKELPPHIHSQEFDAAWNAMLLDIPKERIEILKQLKKKYKIALLSNTNQIHYNCYRKAFEQKYNYKKFNELFDYTFFSHEIGLRKPHREIFDYATQTMKVDFSDWIFIDDTQANIEGAKQLGIHSIFWNQKSWSELPQIIEQIDASK